MTQVRWAILGPGHIAHNFAAGLAATATAELVAVASTSKERADAFGKQWAVADCYASYAEVLQRDDIDAIYIATIHTSHAQLALAALNAGKHVVCEKPAGINNAEVRAIIDCARARNLFFLEAYMYRFHPQIARLKELLPDLGQLEHIEATFGFAAKEDPNSRLFNPDLAGGAILDIGGYPLSMVRLIAGLANGKNFAEPTKLVGTATKASTGVDATAYALLEFDNLTANCAISIARDLGAKVTITGSDGSIELTNPWIPGKAAAPADAEILVNGQAETVTAPAMLYAYEAQAATTAILAGATEATQMRWEDSIGNSKALDDWLAQVNYVPPQSLLANSQPLTGVLRQDIKIPRLEIPGVKLPVSQFVMGCDNQNTEHDAAIIWDAWLEAGGNAFDTAHLYGEGCMEKLLGKWLQSRGVREEVIITVKGAHTPWCDPINLKLQFEESLERLNIDRADIYMMHRDNLDYGVDEFVDVMNELADAGYIDVYGGSNWTLPRIQEANAWAVANGKRPFRVLSNNLSLAVMMDVWEGCKTAHNAELLAYLEQEQIAHLSWSSQARGYFLPEEIRGFLPAEIGPEHCFGSEANAARRHRAEELAKQKSCTANQIALAWVLCQSIKSFALIGPRSPGEITTTLPALAIKLTPEELRWLDTGAD